MASLTKNTFIERNRRKGVMHNAETARNGLKWPKSERSTRARTNGLTKRTDDSSSLSGGKNTVPDDDAMVGR